VSDIWELGLEPQRSGEKEALRLAPRPTGEFGSGYYCTVL
jgi:hypothetical protein